ncbi:MAG TPA: tyrosine-type recombinase/integrase [Anaerolineaceae bacterium]|nr:tyrosine-type recombinase/integrase [Anaerolineaceae bacterium]
MNLSKATEGLFFSLKADGYSQATIDLYRIMLKNLTEFLDDPEVQNITTYDLTRYFAFLRSDYQPQRKSGSIAPLSGSTLQNHWKAIKCFFNWASVEFSLQKRPDEKLKLPPNNPKVIMPLSESDIKAILTHAEYSREAKTNSRNSFKMKRTTSERDIALIIFLLDTGVRSGEACRLNIMDLDLEKGEVFIAPYGSSKRKTKSRVLPIGKATRRVIWRYLASRSETDENDPLFLTVAGKRMNPNSVRLLLTDLGVKANVPNCHPHRFRHTFAVQYLRNDGDIFTLQMILGHESLDMVRFYLQLANSDAVNAHRRSSPADNWKL